MSWTKFTCFFAICALLAAPVMADPSLSVALDDADIGGGVIAPVLGANGGFVWNIGLDLDESLYEDYDDSPDRGRGGSGAIDVGFTFVGPEAAVATVDASNAPSEFAGHSVFSDEAIDWEGVEIGSDATNVAVSLGSEFFTSASTTNIVDVHNLASIETAPLHYQNLTSTISWGGSYTSDGQEGGTTHGGIAQDNGAGSQYGTTGSATYTAEVGDVNLDGFVNITDLGILSGNWLSTGGFWQNGNLNNADDDVVNITDLGILSGNWLGGTPPAAVGGLSTVSVPEPASLLIAGLGVLGMLSLSRRRA